MNKSINIPGQVYQVGGSVRDQVMNKESSDLDYVVVGATAEDMLQNGFKQVGKDFPVFLHPITGDEYALARLERKTGNGYHGFETITGTEVSLEDDLSRRDLTINAMALDKDGNIIDPYHGQEDIKNRKLKHVSDAFEEDPLRILRVARFAARFEFSVDPITLSLMQKIHDSGETKFLTKERIWKETERALLHNKSSLYWKVLEDVGLKQDLFPLLLSGDNFEYERIDSIFLNNKSDLASRIINWSLPVNTNNPAPTEELINMWNNMSITKEIRDRLIISCNFWNIFHNLSEEERFTPNEQWYDVLIKLDGLRRPERLLLSYQDTVNQFSLTSSKFLPETSVIENWINTLKVDAKTISQQGDPKTVKERIEAARLEKWKELRIPSVKKIFKH